MLILSCVVPLHQNKCDFLSHSHSFSLILSLQFSLRDNSPWLGCWLKSKWQHYRSLLYQIQFTECGLHSALCEQRGKLTQCSIFGKYLTLPLCCSGKMNKPPLYCTLRIHDDSNRLYIDILPSFWINMRKPANVHYLGLSVRNGKMTKLLLETVYIPFKDFLFLKKLSMCWHLKK